MTDEPLERRMYTIPALPKKRTKVAIYCRVSTEHGSQDESLEAQVAMLKEYVAWHPDWTIYKVYTDRDSGGNVARWGFQEMILDAYENRFSIVLVKTISRFARNTVDLLETVRRLKSLGTEIYFYQEQLSTSEASDDILISTLSAVAQAESESIGESIKWGIRRRLISGQSKLYARRCFGYCHDEHGELVIDEEQAEVVQLIYDLYLSGNLACSGRTD